MDPVTIARVRLRGILDSRGCPTVEADVALTNGRCCRASAPAAIAPGRRERARSHVAQLGPLDGDAQIDALCRALADQRFADQASLDARLDELPAARMLGADVRMSISVAFLRAHAGDDMVAVIAALAGTRPTLPRLLVNVWSGGVHSPGSALPYQQVMFVPDTGSFAGDLASALAVYADVECGVADAGPVVYSASSGMIANGRSAVELLDRLAEAIARAAPHDRAAIGVDVAAEHLVDSDGAYRLGGERLDGAGALDHHRALLAAYPIAYLEDPFAPDHADLWRALASDLPPRARVFGDDLFATDPARIDSALADGLVVKVNQIGTLGGALAAAGRARAQGMALCVSHRSGETEDPLICDLAVALGADFLKLGGPRRGDRTARYNHLVRLAEVWDRTLTVS